MLQKIVLECTYSGERKASCHWGSLLHGALMELLPEDAAGSLHANDLRPFSQYVLPRPDNRLEWHIGLWDSALSEAIARAVMPLSALALKHKGVTLEVTGISRQKKSEREFIAPFFTAAAPCRQYELEFLTPCTHKSAGEYVLYPTPELIVQSLHMRFGAFAREVSLDDAEAMAQLAAHMRISRYFLRSASYHLEGARVFGYLGRITLSIRGPEQLARLAGMLLSFAEYGGVGVKTSLGMGGCRVAPVAAAPRPSAREEGKDV